MQRLFNPAARSKIAVVWVRRKTKQKYQVRVAVNLPRAKTHNKSALCAQGAHPCCSLWKSEIITARAHTHPGARSSFVCCFSVPTEQMQLKAWVRTHVFANQIFSRLMIACRGCSQVTIIMQHPCLRVSREVIVISNYWGKQQQCR